MRTIGTALLALAAVAAVSVTTSAHAQTPDYPSVQRPHRIRLGVAGGVDVPTSRAGDVFKSGLHGQGFLLVNLGFLPSLRFNVGYSRFDYKADASQALPGGATSRILSGVVGLKMDLLHGPVRPYVLAGLGAFNLESSSDAASSSSTKFGIDGGAGLSFKLGRIDGFIEGRIQNVYTDKGMIDTKSIKTIPVTFGIIF